QEKLAACVNLLPEIESIYRWKGKIEAATETLALIKTTIGKYQQLEQRIRALHPYEVPEIIALRPHDGLPDYLNWIEQSVQ
ncbi:MAG: periplasmic divalent cation tolerance protein, partial [Chthoniobacter sp.]|nr:periplasmic divalent cation tolerance protein [Chthoniobacter sp.]